MKELKIAGLLGLGILLFSQAHAQEEKTPKWKPSYFNTTIGGFSGSGDLFTKDDFIRLAPNEKQLKNDELTWYNYSSDYGSNFGLSVEFSKLGKGQSEYRKNQTLRFGLLYQSRQIASVSGSKYTSTPYDTLRSERDDYTLIRYDYSSASYYADYAFEELRLDVSYLFRTDEDRRFNLYTGFGLNIGSTFNSKITSTYSEYDYSSSNSYGGYYGYGSSNGSDYQTTKLKNKLVLGAYVPLGVDVRWGNKNTFFNRIHSTFELRPMFEYTDGKAFTSIGYNFGLRIKI